MAVRPHARPGFGFGQRLIAIFLMFCAAAASRHWMRTHQTSEAGIAVAEELLGVGEGALDGLLAAAVDGFAPCRQTVGVGALTFVLPDMTGDQPGRVRACGAGGE